MEIGDLVTIAAGKHKDKSATVRKFTSSEVCCYVDNEFYFWFQPEELSKPMTIKFPQTEAIASQIAQLQEQLKKYQDCESNANQLKEQVAQQAKLMLELEVEQSAIVDWSNRLYFLATGIDLRNISAQTDVATIDLLQKENASLIAKIKELEALTDDMDAQLSESQLMPESEALNQEIEGLKSSNKILRQEREQLEAKLNIYKQDTKEVDSYIHELQQLREENDKLQKLYEGQKAQKEQWESDYYKIRNERDRLSAIEKNHPNQFQVGNTVKTEAGDTGEVTGFAYGNVIVKLPSGEFQFSHNLLTKVEREYSTDLIAGDIVKHENGGVGTVTYVPEPFRGIVSVKMVDGRFSYHADKLTFISRPTPEPEQQPELTDAEAQAKASEFIGNIKTKSAASEIVWTTIKEICQKDVRVLREIGLAARIKVQKELVENIPELLAEYIKLSGDRSDLDWVGNVIKVKAEELLEQKRQAQIDSFLEAIPEGEEVLTPALTQ